jgi:hypothetical protein
VYDLFFIFTVFRLLTDFVCLYNYEFGLSLCKIVRSSVILLLTIFCFPLHLSDKLQINETFYCCHIWKRFSIYMYARWCFQKQIMHEIAAMRWAICDAQRLRNRHWLLPGVTYYYYKKNCSWNVVVHQMWTCTYIIGEGAHYAASPPSSTFDRVKIIITQYKTYFIDIPQIQTNPRRQYNSSVNEWSSLSGYHLGR